MSGSSYNILFLCLDNSARSIIAEVLLNHFGRPRFRAWSAGSFPAGEVDPLALEVLARANLPVAGLRSKSRDEFAVPDAPKLDLVITVCDLEADEVCPVWPGQPATVHWAYPDPREVEGEQPEKLKAFEMTLREMQRRIQLLVNLPLEKLDRLALERGTRSLGAPQGGS